MLCQICSSIDLDAANATLDFKAFRALSNEERRALGYKHHANFGLLKRTAQDGCELCRLMLKLSNYDEHIDGKSQLRLRLASDRQGFILQEEGDLFYPPFRLSRSATLAAL